MSSITNHGMMVGGNAGSARKDPATQVQFNVIHSSQPKGTLYIKNEQTGAEKRISLSNTPSDTIVWDSATDDPTFATLPNGTDCPFTISFGGKADLLKLNLNADGGAGDGWATFDGNGHSELSGVILQAWDGI